MRKDIAPELYNYNKFPGPEFRQVDSQILSDRITFEMVENYREGFDLTAFNQRFSEILTKFDYIVGDWGNEQLRLRGFYKDEKPVDPTHKISRLEDYLLEYCNFGCAYFVLENPQPQRASFDKKSHGKKEDGRSHRQRDQRQSHKDRTHHQTRDRKPRQDKKKDYHTKKPKNNDKRHFVIRQK